MDVAGRVVAATRAAGGLLLCTDYDGTLAPIAATPEEAHAVPAAVEALTWLSRAGAAAGTGGFPRLRVAIVTSRSSADLVGRLRLGPEAVVIGSSGLERWTAGHVELDPEVVPWLPAITEATGLLATALAGDRVAGARLERKQCGVVIHIRGVHRESAEREAVALAREVGGRTGLRVLVGKRAVELRPPLDRDKGSAVRDLRRGAFRAAALCVAGDDLPDVPMLEIAAAVEPGLAVAVADVETPNAVLDAARLRVDGPWEWASALRELVQLLCR